MDVLTVTESRNLYPEQELATGLFSEFVSWIDRSEKTTASYITNLRQFAAWLRFTNTAVPLRPDVISYRDWLSEEHEAIQLAPDTEAGWIYRTDRSGNPLRVTCKPNTVAQYLRSVCQFFRWTAAQGVYPDIAANIHAPKITHNTHRKEALSPADVLTIERSIERTAHEAQEAAASATKDKAGKVQRSREQGLRLDAMYQLAVNAGLRTVEISRANVRDLETRAGKTWLYIWGKGHTEADQRKPIAPEVAAVIRAYLDSRTDHPTGSSPLFVSTGNRSKGKRISPTTISKMLKRAMVEAGFESDRITPHSLRHTAGTNVMELTGRNIYTTQQYMRHSNPATTEIYLHTDNEKTEADIAERLYSLYHGIESTDADREKLNQIVARMSPQQLEQLTGIAKAMSR